VHDAALRTAVRPYRWDDKPPLSYTHFKAEGDVEFKSILFIPEVAPSDMFDNYYNKAGASTRPLLSST